MSDERRIWRGWRWLQYLLDPASERRRSPLERFLELSLEMAEHTLGQDFTQAMRTFPSAKFHEWCELAKLLESMRRKP